MCRFVDECPRYALDLSIVEVRSIQPDYSAWGVEHRPANMIDEDSLDVRSDPSIDPRLRLFDEGERATYLLEPKGENVLVIVPGVQLKRSMPVTRASAQEESHSDVLAKVPQ